MISNSIIQLSSWEGGCNCGVFIIKQGGGVINYNGVISSSVISGIIKATLHFSPEEWEYD